MAVLGINCSDAAILQYLETLKINEISDIFITVLELTLGIG